MNNRWNLRMRLGSLPLIALLVATLPVDPVCAAIVTTNHNLSASGTGEVKASGEPGVCIFCHSSHNTSPAGSLWNRNDPGTSYIPYYSSTVQALPGQPSGSSILCLSCHDGVIALGELINRDVDIMMDSGVTTLPVGPSHLDTDLSDDHPISFVYADSYAGNPFEYVNPTMLPESIQLDSMGRLQCTACHDPHENTLGDFLHLASTDGLLCLACHDNYGWSESAHKTSTAAWDDRPVSEHACSGCHKVHAAAGSERLLQHADEEENCYGCHDGLVAEENIQGEFTKQYRHPVGETTGVHDPIEDAIISSRHVECLDCHNPHATNSTDPLAVVRGVSITGSEMILPTGISDEYQLCFRCHGDSANKPAPLTVRLHPETNTRVEFSTSNPSYHPVVGEGQNGDMPSLIEPLTATSIILCTDCHSNNDSDGPSGPHGSIYPQLLVDRFDTLDPSPESSSAYGLCYNCHSRDSILNDNSFDTHSLHISDDQTSCNICHDPHGSSQYPMLINFDTAVVLPNDNGVLDFFTSGPSSGGCNLKCHGDNHQPECYGNKAGPNCVP